MKTYTIEYNGKIEVDANSQDEAMDILLNDLRGKNVLHMNIVDESDSW